MNWDLMRFPPTWDFFHAALMAKWKGHEQIDFLYRPILHHWKLPENETWQRVRRLLIPIVELLGMDWTMRPSWHEFEQTLRHDIRTMNETARTIVMANQPLLLLRPQRPERPQYCTVTLRESHFHEPSRNSNKPEWLRFITWLQTEQGIQTFVLDDNEQVPFSPAQRLAIYAGAIMNYGTSTGPMALCQFSSNLPYCVWMYREGDEIVRRHCERNGFLNQQWCFARPNQRLIWEEESFESMVEQYQKGVDDERSRQSQAAEGSEILGAV